MRVTLALVVAAAALGLWAVWSGAPGTRTGRSVGTRGGGSAVRAAAPDDAAGDTTGSELNELSSLRARVTQLEGVVAELQRKLAAGAAPVPANAEPTSSSRLPASEEGLAPVAVDLAGEFARAPEPRQPLPRTGELAARLTALLPSDGRLDRLECRGELCRVETTHHGMLRYREFLSAAFTNAQTRVWRGTTQFELISDPAHRDPEQGEVAVVAYLGPERAQTTQPTVDDADPTPLP